MNNMNCLEFRRMAQSRPHHLPQPAQAHMESCAACENFLKNMRQVDEAVVGTVNGVAIPEGLTERILLRTSKRHTLPWQQWALAASVVMGVALALILPLLRADAGLARAALAHVEEEPDKLIAQQQVAPLSVDTALASIGAKLRGDIGQVTYLGSCPLPGGEGKHLVVTSPYGRYTLILMQAHSNNRKKVESGMHAAVAKPASHGTYAIVASATPDLIKIEKLLEQNVSW